MVSYFQFLGVIKYTLVLALSRLTGLLDLSSPWSFLLNCSTNIYWNDSSFLTITSYKKWTKTHSQGFTCEAYQTFCWTVLFFFLIELESVTGKVAKPVLCMPGSARDLFVWKLHLPVGAWKERKSWTLDFVLVSSRGTLLGTGGCWLKSLYFKPSIKHSFKPVLKDAFPQCSPFFPLTPGTEILESSLPFM